MFFVIFHHFVVNSNLINEIITSENIGLNRTCLLMLGAWGKTCINSFVLITGYFMCKSSITLKKFLKLLFTVMFYRIIIYLIFYFTRYISFNIIDFVLTIVSINNISTNFDSCYLVFYLFIPFLQKLINNINRKQHLTLIGLCLFTYVFIGTMPFVSVTMNYVSLFMVLFFIGSYIRLYPLENYDKKSCVWGYIILYSNRVC